MTVGMVRVVSVNVVIVRGSGEVSVCVCRQSTVTLQGIGFNVGQHMNFTPILCFYIKPVLFSRGNLTYGVAGAHISLGSLLSNIEENLPMCSTFE